MHTSSITAIIVTYNPSPSRFKLVLTSVTNQVSHVIIIDNNSKNKDFIDNLCKDIYNCDLIKMNFNFGIAYALRLGIKHAMKYKPYWLLFLDHDTILLNNALNKVLGIINSLPSIIRDKIGIILLGNKNGSCNIQEVKYGIFSGTLIKAEVALKTCCRDNFFLDQADFDMYSKARELGYLTLIINCKLIDHKLGLRCWIPLFSSILRKSISYEPSWRYYYIIRNSTRLLIEGKMDFLFYVNQLLRWSIPVLYIDGLRKLIKTLGLGLMHALLNQLGILNAKNIS